MGNPNMAGQWMGARGTYHCIMGDSYYDHRGSSSGELFIYAMGVPLSLGWESMYSPHNPNPYSRCGVVPERTLSLAWNADLPSPLWSALSRTFPDGFFLCLSSVCEKLN